jgi:ribosomal-protein-alanine N-acetyltransferase
MMADRLVLEALSEQDNHFIFELVNTQGWLEFIGNRNVNSSEEAIGYIQKIRENPNVTYWVAKLKAEREPIGVITLIKRDYLEHHDIGFAFLPRYMNQGYAYEAANAVIAHSTQAGNHAHIQAIVLPANTVSIKLLEKLGFRLERKIEPNNEPLHVYLTTIPKRAMLNNS